MDDRRVGRLVRLVRQNRNLRQADVAAKAGVSQKTVSDVELGRLETVSLSKVRRIASVIDVSIVVDARWRGGGGDRLLDRAHAQLVNTVAAILGRSGWEVRAEFTFNHFGERGSVDLLAWHAPTRTLLIVEVKATITDLQDLLAALSRKVRLVPSIVVGELGWQPVAVARVLVIGDTKSNRTAVAQNAAIFGAAFPVRSRAVRTWMTRPVGELSGLWFLGFDRDRAPAGRDRVRLPAARVRR